MGSLLCCAVLCGVCCVCCAVFVVFAVCLVFMFMRQLSAGRTFKSIKCVLLNRQPEADTEAEAEAGSINSLFGAAQVANRFSQTETSHSQLSVCLSSRLKGILQTLHTHTHAHRERERDRHTHVPAFSAIAITSNVCCKRLLLYFYLISFAFQLAPLSRSLSLSLYEASL